MEIIDELEPHRRGPYGGAVGYVDFSGNMDTCIALRTMVLLGQTAYVQAGAGLVADSVPASEYEETVNKAMSLLRRSRWPKRSCKERPAARNALAVPGLPLLSPRAWWHPCAEPGRASAGR